MDSGGFCLACGKRLKDLKLRPNDKKVYHEKCWKMLLSDIKNFDKVAESKFFYIPLIDGKTLEEHKKCEEPITLHFD